MITVCILYTQKHIRIEKHASLLDMVVMDSSYLPNWKILTYRKIVWSMFSATLPVDNMKLVNCTENCKKEEN